MYTHVPGTALLDTLTVSARAVPVWAPRLSALKPGSLRTGRVPSAPVARCGAAVPSPGRALHRCGRLSPRKVGAAIWVSISQGVIKQQPGAGLEPGQNAGTWGGRQGTRRATSKQALPASPSNFSAFKSCWAPLTFQGRESIICSKIGCQY